MLLTINQHTTHKIILVAHSMGARLTMETLRQLELSRPGWSARALDGVLLISPDVNIDVFRSQAARFQTWPEPFVIFASRQDRFLRISAALRGRTLTLAITSLQGLRQAFCGSSMRRGSLMTGFWRARRAQAFLSLAAVGASVD